MPRGQSRPSTRSFLIVMFVVIVLLIWVDSLGREQVQEKGGPVVIVDPLSSGSEGEFSAACAKLFLSAGYEVEVIRGEAVSVDWLKVVPSGCPVLVMRVHSGVFEESVWVFTGERYDSTRHVLEQLANEVHIARATRGSDPLFAVGSGFVRRYMKGGLEGALVVLMGCDGLASPELADAFMDAGVAAYVSWDGPVSLAHTDRATLALLEGVAGGLTLEEAMERSLERVGPDVRYGSSLRIHPSEGGDFVLLGGQPR